jgi:hypothetical protein
MGDKILWSVTADIPGGPKFKRGQTLDVQAYQHIQVTVPGGPAATPGKVTIKVMPAGSKAQFLLISSSVFHASKLTYKLPSGSTDFVLDMPHLLVGGAIAILGQPEKLEVSNGMGAGNDADIMIVVGRDAS